MRRRILYALFALLTCAFIPLRTMASGCRYYPSANSFDNNNATTNGGKLVTVDFWLPDGTSGASDTLGAFLYNGNSTDNVWSGTDNLGTNTYAEITAAKAIDGTNNQKGTILASTNSNAGVFHMTFTTTAGSGATVNFGGGVAFRCNGLSTAALATAVDIANSAVNAAGTNAPCGALVTTVDGDLIMDFGELDNLSKGTGSSWLQGSGFSLRVALFNDWVGAQDRIQATHGSITPTMTLGVSTNSIKSCVAWKTASVVTPFPSSGLRVVKIIHETIPSGQSGNLTEQIPNEPTANLAAIGYTTSASGPDVSAVSDGTNAYTVPAAGKIITTGADVQWIFSKNFNASADLTATLTRAAGSGGSSVDIILWAGADTVTGVTGFVSASFNQTIAGSLTLVSITPANVGSQLWWVENHFLGSCNGISLTNGIFAATTANLPSEFEPNGMQQNGFLGLYTTTDLTAKAAICTEGDALAKGNGGSVAMEVLAQSAQGFPCGIGGKAGMGGKSGCA